MPQFLVLSSMINQLKFPKWLFPQPIVSITQMASFPIKESQDKIKFMNLYNMTHDKLIDMTHVSKFWVGLYNKSSNGACLLPHITYSWMLIKMSFLSYMSHYVSSCKLWSNGRKICTSLAEWAKKEVISCHHHRARSKKSWSNFP